MNLNKKKGLNKEEKKFWQKHFRIEKMEQISNFWNSLTRIDSQEDDLFFYYISLRVTSISEIHLKETLITDEGLKYITMFNNLKILYLRNHTKITKKSIPYFNQMKSLESLNITKTKITLTDLCEQLNNQNIKEVFLDSEENENNILEKGFILKTKMPNCNIYLNTSFTTEINGNIINPIF
ncbi:hypothetical protein FBBAL38_11694 [Flavobacteria bacterium BAL38]|nr:hypothetical protein FBBAL38_11694 [Flavobacteria bacterium BAL38]